MMETKEILDFLREAEEKGIIESQSLELINNFRDQLEKIYQAAPADVKVYMIDLDDNFIELLKKVREDFFKLGEIYSSMQKVK